MGNAFTTYNGRIVNSLRNDIVVRSGDNSITVKGLWDTGATNSCISIDVVDKLSLIPTGKATVNTPAGASDRNTYLVDLVLPNSVLISDLVVSDSEIGSQNIGLLVGMDIIARGDFAVSNYNGKTAFTFRVPSEKSTDYVKEIMASNTVGAPHGKGKRKKKKKQ